MAARCYSPSIKSPDNVPKGCSSLQFEIYFSKDKPLNLTNDELIEHIIKKSEKMNVFNKEDIVIKDCRFLEYGNVTFYHGMENDRKIILDYLEKLDIKIVGRFGKWERSKFNKWSKELKKVSVVIPTIGRIEYLDKAIESLLNQSIPFSEIIIFDNSIEQNIRELSKYKDNENLHWKKSGKQLDPINSWNMAVKTTSFEYVTVFGDDDIAYNEFHSYIQKNLEKSDFVYINYDIMDENDNITQHNEVTYTSEDI